MAIKFLLDTDVLAEPVKARRDPALIEWLLDHADEVCTAAPVLADLQYAALSLDEGSQARIDLEDFIEQTVLGALPVLSYDLAAAEWHARQMTRLLSRRIRPGWMTGMTAACAASRQMVLITSEEKLPVYEVFAGLAVRTWPFRATGRSAVQLAIGHNRDA